MPQLSFRWPLKESYASEDFLLSGCNAAAAAFLDGWPGNDASAAILTGPQASGKTHLVMRWRARMQAATIDRAALGTVSSSSLWKDARAAVLEDVHTLAKEPALFHLLRHAEAHRLALLLTSRPPARKLAFELPDLRSRLFALPEARIEAPDETLLAGYLAKCFADRQWRVEEGVSAYLAARMERSFATARALVDALEKTAAQSRREITVPLARSVLGGLAAA